MKFLFGFTSIFVHIIFMYKREWLFEMKSFSVIVMISVGLFVLSYILLLNGIVTDFQDRNLVRGLTFPLQAAGIFYVLKLIFFRIYKRNAEDTFWSMDMSQMKDGIFNALFWFLGIMLPAIITFVFLRKLTP